MLSNLQMSQILEQWKFKHRLQFFKAVIFELINKKKFTKTI